jgi:predicted nuclease of restriction endonuclease-like RecB superfamily
VVLASGDPIFPAAEPRLYDSRLEERFARDFRRVAPDWDVVREPEPVPAGDALIFPDFALYHRRDAERRWLLEIVGFWTADYLARKLLQYRTAHLSNLILCIDEHRNCAAGDLPAGALVVRFRRRVDAAAVLRLVG